MNVWLGDTEVEGGVFTDRSHIQTFILKKETKKNSSFSVRQGNFSLREVNQTLLR